MHRDPRQSQTSRVGAPGTRHRQQQRQQGMVLVAGIFVLLGLTALGGYMLSLSGGQHAAVLLSAQGRKAGFAAHAGIEWAISDLVNNGGAGLDCAGGTVTLNLTEAALDGFSVSVTCASASATEGLTDYTFYALEADATLGAVGRPDYVRRVLQASIVL